jgi:hypothetical protein
MKIWISELGQGLICTELGRLAAAHLSARGRTRHAVRNVPRSDPFLWDTVIPTRASGELARTARFAS